MNTEDNKQEAAVTPEGTEGEGGQGTEDNIIKLSKEDYDKLQNDLGSLKRENKQLKKPKEDSKEETPKSNRIPETLEILFFLRISSKLAKFPWQIV